MNEPKNASEVPVVALTQDVESFSDGFTLAERRNDLFEKVKTIALKSTNVRDWIDQNGNPFLQGSGAEKVMRTFGLRVWDVKSERFNVEDEKGSYYYFRYSAKVGFSEREYIEAVGTCSSRDQFFAIRNGQLLPMAEVDITNIEKSAYTNCISNGVKRFLGIRSVTWEEIESIVGVRRDQVQRVEYQKGQKSSLWTAEHQVMAKRIGNFLLAEADGNKEMASSRLEKLTAFKGKEGDVPGKRELKHLSGRQVEILFSKLQKSIVEFESAGVEVENGR